MNQDNSRTILFRAMLREQPAPLPAEIEHAKTMLSDDPTFQRDCAALVGVVLHKDQPEAEKWRTRLQAYVAAQLAGHAYTDEFADVRQVLDTDVALAEEYALLYTTMEAEARLAIPVPSVIPAPKFDFLSPPTPLSTWRYWFQKLGLQRLADQATSTHTNVNSLRRLAQVATILILTAVVATGTWRSHAPVARLISDSDGKSSENLTNRPSFYEFQSSLETPPPIDPLLSASLAEIAQPTYCPELRHNSLVRKKCPL